MRTAIKLLILGSAIGAASMIGRRRTALDRSARREDEDTEADADAGDAPLVAGISEVDPQPLTQIAGEGIDPDATRAAHDEPREQRERLPVHGRNLP